MFGLSNTTSANASLLNNFEIVATSIIAMFIFKEVITKRLWIAIFLITISSMLLSFENLSSLKFSWGSIFVLLATVCWGFENNCTRNISYMHTHDGSTHAHTINHTHLHYHFGKNIKHEHFHNKETLVHR